MNESIEHLLAVEPYALSESERRALYEALAADDDLAAVALSLQAFREAIDEVADPSAADAPAPAWRAPAGEAPEPAAARRRRRWPVWAAAALLVGVLVAVVMAAARRGGDVPAFLQEPLQRIVAPETTPTQREGATRPTPTRVDTSKVLATFQADTATIDLVGVEVPAAVPYNEAFAMTLYWRVRTPFPENPTATERWRVFVHFDNETERSRFQADHLVMGDDQWWLSGEVVADRFAVLGGHSGQPRGTYDVYVGWFKGGPGTWTNAKLSGEGGAKKDPYQNDRLHVGRIVLE